MSINRVVLVGRLVRDPELKYTSNGVPVCSFVLAINRPFKNANDENEADFINCVVWRKPAENVANFLKKGSLAGVDGRLQTRNYEGQDGKRVYITEVQAESVQFLEPRGTGGQNTAPTNQGNTNTSDGNSNANSGQQTRQDDPFAGGQIDISDDMLPF